MPPSVETCVVCRRLRKNTSPDQADDLFVCSQCKADADQLFAIQDEIWPPVDVAGNPTDGAATPTQP